MKYFPSSALVLSRRVFEGIKRLIGIRRIQFAFNRRSLAASVAAGRRHIGRLPGVGVRIVVDPQMYMHRAYTDYVFERHVVVFMRDWLRSDDTFLDVGANVGVLSIIGAECVGSHGRVVAFEPGEFAFSLLERNCELNKLAMVERMRLALGDSTGSIDLHEGMAGYDAYSSIGRVVHASAVDGSYRKVSVPIMRGDEWWRDHGRPRVRLLKVDVEGAEYQVLRGFYNTLAAGLIDAVLVEITEDMARACGHSARETWDLMIQLGYSWWKLSGYGALSPLHEYDSCEIMFLALRREK